MVEPDIDKGSKLIRALESHKLPPKAAFWLMDESVWRLILQIPALEQVRPTQRYRRIQEVIRTSPDSFPELADITLVSSDFPLLGVLRRALSVPAGANAQIRLTRNTFNGTFIEDAFIYRL